MKHEKNDGVNIKHEKIYNKRNKTVSFGDLQPRQYLLFLLICMSVEQIKISLFIVSPIGYIFLSWLKVFNNCIPRRRSGHSPLGTPP